jgi:hypothetical protein
MWYHKVLCSFLKLANSTVKYSYLSVRAVSVSAGRASSVFWVCLKIWTWNWLSEITWQCLCYLVQVSTSDRTGSDRSTDKAQQERWVPYLTSTDLVSFSVRQLLLHSLWKCKFSLFIHSFIPVVLWLIFSLFLCLLIFLSLFLIVTHPSMINLPATALSISATAIVLFVWLCPQVIWRVKLNNSAHSLFW